MWSLVSLANLQIARLLIAINLKFFIKGKLLWILQLSALLHTL